MKKPRSWTLPGSAVFPVKTTLNDVTEKTIILAE
jgi:hypothetical protein